MGAEIVVEPATDRPLTQRPAWKEVEAHSQEVPKRHLRELFAADPERGQRLTSEAAGICLDYSKNRINDETIKLLLRLADESGLRKRIDAMFRGEKINKTENRRATCSSSGIGWEDVTPWTRPWPLDHARHWSG